MREREREAAIKGDYRGSSLLRSHRCAMKDARKIIMRIWQANRAVDVFSYPKRSTRIPPIEGPTAALRQRMGKTGQASEGEQRRKQTREPIRC